MTLSDPNGLADTGKHPIFDSGNVEWIKYRYQIVVYWGDDSITVIPINEKRK